VPEHAAMITALLVERAMCVQCVAKKCDMDTRSVEMYLGIIARTLAMHRTTQECLRCGVVRETVTLDRP
jgi:hypothetical protein